MATVSWFPVILSLQVASIATVLNVVFGTALAWLLARTQWPGRDLFGALFSLPLILPPTVLGYYLLVALGRQSPLGQWLDQIGLPLVFTWRGAVVASSIVALPLIVQSARAALESVDTELENVARTLGRSEVDILFSITLPLAWRGLFAGTLLCFARALGDFGTTLMVAGNIPDRTQTLPLAIYDAVQANNAAAANTMVLMVTIGAVILIICAQRLARRLAV